MTKDLDRFFDWLEQRLQEDAESAFSARVLKELRYPANLVWMTSPDAAVVVNDPCGDTMEISLRLKGEAIAKATFFTDGCGPTLACGSMLTRLIQGMPLAEAMALQPHHLRRPRRPA